LQDRCNEGCRQDQSGDWGGKLIVAFFDEKGIDQVQPE